MNRWPPYSARTDPDGDPGPQSVPGRLSPSGDLRLAGQSPDYSQAETFESQFDPSAQEAFQAFFRFPFAPDTRWKVTVTKDQDGLLTQLAIAPTGEEFLTGTVSTVGAHTAYFTLTPSTQTGSTLPDFQQVPGGYGSTGCAS